MGFFKEKELSLQRSNLYDMATRLTKKAVNLFDSIRRQAENGMEYWSARDLAKALGYVDYRNFQTVINKAKTACENSGQKVNYHFVEATEMIKLPKTAERQIDTVFMTRYACYLSVQNADPTKTIVAQAQTYFAIQTRIAEVKQTKEYEELTSEEEKRLFLRSEVTKHNALLAGAAKDAGVIDTRDYAIFQNYGYKDCTEAWTQKIFMRGKV